MPKMRPTARTRMARVKKALEEAQLTVKPTIDRENGNEKVNMVPHYKGDYVMRIIEDFDLEFCLGNVVKYTLRAGRKSDNGIEDLEKARWYLDRYIKRQKGDTT